jgi:thiol-disulfide isomerase/thioredoxin
MLIISFDATAQEKFDKEDVQSVLKRVHQLYASFTNSQIKYEYYRKNIGKMDTIWFSIDLKHHTKTGKLFGVVHDKSLDSTHHFYKAEIALPKKNAKDLQLFTTGEAYDKRYGTASIKYSIFPRWYIHLPIINPDKFFSTISKTTVGMFQTANHYTITSKNYILKINKQYEIEEIIYNNQKKDIENRYERLVIKEQKYNLPSLNDLSVYNIKLPERYNEAKYFTKKLSLPLDTLAPNWECPDVSSDKTLQLSDYKGKVVILDFWNTSCAPCIKFLPKMKELQAEFADKEVIFIGMAFDKSKENIVKHLEKHAGGVFYTNVLYTEKENKAYKVVGAPHFFVIDKEQRIVYSHEGTKDAKEALQKYIQIALDKK